MDLASVPGVARAGQRFKQPEGGDVEGPGKALGSAAASGAAFLALDSKKL